MVLHEIYTNMFTSSRKKGIYDCNRMSFAVDVPVAGVLAVGIQNH